MESTPRKWIHQHRFRERDGNKVIEDEVVYKLPLSPLSQIAYPMVRWQLGLIFAYRQEAIRGLLLSGQ